MLDRFDIKSKSKPTTQIKGKAAKPKSKTNSSSYTPNKFQTPKELPYNNSQYNINNNISININI